MVLTDGPHWTDPSIEKILFEKEISLTRDLGSEELAYISRTMDSTMVFWFGDLFGSLQTQMPP